MKKNVVKFKSDKICTQRILVLNEEDKVLSLEFEKKNYENKIPLIVKGATLHVLVFIVFV